LDVIRIPHQKEQRRGVKMAACSILFAGFGGQGILFSGKIMAYAGLIENKE
jgi:hypothetical protein